MKSIDIVFTGPLSASPMIFVGAEDMEGKSIGVGEWIQREDGYWALRIDGLQEAAEESPAVLPSHYG